MNTNKFDHQIPEISELLNDDSIRSYIKNTLSKVFGMLGVEKEDLAEQVLSLAREAKDDQSSKEYEIQCNGLLKKNGITDEDLDKKLTGRVDLIYNQIRKHIQGTTVLDLGCGDGKVGERVAQDGLEVTLADVYENDHVKTTGLKFVPLEQGVQNDFEGQKYDNTLLLTVMHHSNDPIGTLKQARDVTKKSGRIVVIESVFNLNPHYALRYSAEEFMELSGEQQRKANIFFDHFYNRIIHFKEDPKMKVNVPYNFNSPCGWNKEAEKLGLEVKKTIYLGIDQKIVPEYHTLHVFEVK